ncbi:hypothetical protein [Hymenobacter sp. BT491]|uniref:hypothetical protein n=1 Tax=Hymenobacter sp. BT491 TaxID=2766779 RepID=UPI001653CCA7|nr:hypothetical protein [Hymenobacter sp. BT491]MBC6990438.1 hypothetical protein [Hymenobacter sp. BT491]
MQSKFTQEADFRQERDFGMKISATFEFLAAHARPLGKAVVYIVLPVALVTGISLGLAQASVFNRALTQPNRDFSAFGAIPTGLGYFVGLAGLLLTYVLLAATVYGYVLLRMESSVQEEVTPRMVWQKVRGTAPWMLLSLVGVSILLGIAFVLLFVPGIYLAVPLSLFMVVMVMEGGSFDRTLRRCLSLISGKWWSTLGLIFVMTLIQSFLNIIFQIPQYLVLAAKVMHWPVSDIAMMITQSIATVGASLLYIPTIVALMFQYFNLVERKEGIGLRALVDSIGQKPAVVEDYAYRPDEEGEY